ncbi:MAG: diguanylate cyclase [Deltaproteobacteria bacterium]|nr:diguanylate cyclase [Deltaproteobacteria bacterium]
MSLDPTQRASSTHSSIGHMLVVDEEESNLRFLSRAFDRQFAIHQARDGEEALTIARSIRPDVVVTEQQLSSIDGAAFLARIRSELPDTIRVLVTGRHDYASLVETSGTAAAQRHLERPFHTVDLKTLVDALYQNRENRRLATRDSLTNLFNRRYFVEHLKLELARERRCQKPLCVLFIDVDDFKRINDRFGHAVGDQVLRSISRLFSSEDGGLRASDFAVRYGGEEFCVVLPDTPLSGGLIKANRIREAAAALDWSSLADGLPGPLTVSVGVAAFPLHGATVDELVAAADAAQYEAKRAGKNRVFSAAAFPA